ncbi:MAG: sulfatase-like hydrolase/transferase, partial [Bacteroidales bacterium]
MIWKAFFEKTGKNILLALGILLFLSNTTTQAGEADADNRQKPNIVFVLVDDLGWTDINIFDPLKRNFYETPNIDKLANQGMMFTQAYSNAANCAPSRAALLSGQYYPHQPIYHVGSPG